MWGTPSCFSYQWETKDLQENGVYQGETKDLWRKASKRMGKVRLGVEN